jgi:hypothetical protein
MRPIATGALFASVVCLAGCGSASGADGGLLLRYEKTQEGRRTVFVVAEQGTRKWTADAGLAMMFDGDHYAYCNPRGCRTGHSKSRQAEALYVLPFLSPNDGTSFATAHPSPAPPRVIGGQRSSCEHVIRESREEEVCVATHGGFLTYAGHPKTGDKAVYVLRSVRHAIPASLSRLPAPYAGL